MQISILDFIKTGKFGVVEIGQSMKWIADNFPAPDDVSDMGHDMFIWRYSVFEFHFMSGFLNVLWCDNLSYLESPQKGQFKLDKWIIDGSRNLEFPCFCSILEKEGIEYNVVGSYLGDEDQIFPDNIILNVDGTNTEIYFEDTKDRQISVDIYNLMAIGASLYKNKYKVRPL